jgi:hypothetical protein
LGCRPDINEIFTPTHVAGYRRPRKRVGRIPLS